MSRKLATAALFLTNNSNTATYVKMKKFQMNFRTISCKSSKLNSHEVTYITTAIWKRRICYTFKSRVLQSSVASFPAMISLPPFLIVAASNKKNTNSNLPKLARFIHTHTFVVNWFLSNKSRKQKFAYVLIEYWVTENKQIGNKSNCKPEKVPTRTRLND